MGNLLIGIKRFFQSKNTVTLIALMACVGIIYFSYNQRIKAKTTPMNVPYATRELGPRTYITSDMVSVRKVPGGAVTKDVMTNTNDIIGKYVINTAVVPQGGLFYKSMIITWDEFPESLFADIPDGYTVYNLKVDAESTYGNSIFPGNYIDIYFRANVNENGNKVWIGKFIENIKVLAVVDGTGKSVFETNKNPGAPASLMFAVPDEIYLLFTKVEKTGRATLFPVQRNAKYANSKEAKDMKVVGSEFVSYIERYVVPDSEVNGGN